MSENRICTRCVIDSQVPNVEFDSNGVCNYCHQFDMFCQDSPMGEAGKKILNSTVEAQKKAGKNGKYDVLIGLSGGTDSCYMLHLAAQCGLRVLALHLDNGWNSDISVSNMKKLTSKLNIELEVLTVSQTELNDLFLAYMKAGLPWIDGPTDAAINAMMYATAAKYNIKYIWVGSSFRTEGKQPDSWTHTDSRLTKHVHKRFGTVKLQNFVDMTLWNLTKWWIIKRIKMVRPLNYIEYNKTEVKKFLAQEYDWEDYGGHHYENDFTKFALINWLYPKFGIDKRKITLGACVRAGEIGRAEALAILANPPASPEECLANRRNVEKRLNLSPAEMDALLAGENHTFLDYPSYWNFYKRFGKIINFVFTKVLCFRPMMSYELKKYKDQ